MHFLKEKICDPRFIKKFLIAMIILYPLAGAFLGLDLGDTGYHLYAYENLAAHPDQINYTTYLSSVIGYLWGSVAGGLGLLGYNLLEVFLEWGTAALVYFTLRKLMGENVCLAGCLFSIIAMDTYLNVFNYHQLNACLLTLILCMEYQAIITRRSQYSLYAGIAYTFVVFSRVGSIVAIISLFLYVFDYLAYSMSEHRLKRHLFKFGLGAGSSFLAVVLLMLVTGRASLFVNNIFRLGSIANDSESAYGFSNLLSSLLTDILRCIAAGLVFFGAGFLLLFSVNMILKKWDTPRKQGIWTAAGALIAGIAIVVIRYDYHLTPVEKWPQMTGGPRFVIGVMYVVTFFCLSLSAFRESAKSRALTIVSIASVMLVMLTIAGSNTGTKHVVLAMWLIAPLCIYTVKSMICSDKVKEMLAWTQKALKLPMHPRALQAVAFILLFMFFLKYAHMAWYTNNYDSRYRSELTSTVRNSRVKGILTTPWEADSLNGVLDAVDVYAENDDQPLVVFGNSLLFYYMTDREAYSVPWMTQNTYGVARFKEDLAAAEEKYGENLPIVIYCRTNYAWGFHDYDYKAARNEILRDDYGGKKINFMNFLKRHLYGVAYANDFYAVMIPKFTMDRTSIENILYGYRIEDINEKFY